MAMATVNATDKKIFFSKWFSMGPFTRSGRYLCQILPLRFAQGRNDGVEKLL